MKYFKLNLYYIKPVGFKSNNPDPNKTVQSFLNVQKLSTN